MKKLQALVIDDEPLAHKVILEYAKDIPFLEISYQVYKAMDAYAILESEEIDLIFLDINMPRLQGLDFLKTLKHAPAVIITSAYEEYALQGYELQVLDYLLKPFRFERFLKAVNHVKENLRGTNTSQEKSQSNEIDSSSEVLFIKVDRKHVQLNVQEIYFLESYGNYVKIWLEDSMHLTPRTLTSFESDIPASFSRIHKSFIVNRNHINYVQGNMIFLRNKKELPIGKNHKQDLKKWFD